MLRISQSLKLLRNGNHLDNQRSSFRHQLETGTSQFSHCWSISPYWFFYLIVKTLHIFFANHIFAKIVIAALLLLSFVDQSLALTLPFRLSWTRNSESDLAYYTVYYGTSSGSYNYFADVDKQNYTFLFHDDLLASNNLSIGPEGLTLYIALTAIDHSLNESDYSTELAVFIDSPTTTSTLSDKNTFCSSDPVLFLTGTIPEEGTLNVNMTDNPASAISSSLILALYDPDMPGEGYIYINGNGPIDLPVGGNDYDSLENTFEVPINPDWLVQGVNSFRFTHVDTWGYEVRELCVGLSFSSTPATTTIPNTSTITTSVPGDTTPPTGTIVIGEGEAATSARLVTLNLAANDTGSGMGASAQMMLSNDNENWIGPKPFVPTKTWVLSVGEGVKTVYAKFSDAAGNWMNEPVNDSIELTLSCTEPVQLEPTAIDCSGIYLNLWSDEKAVDGKPATGWLSPQRRTMQEEYLTLDLGEAKIISRIDISSKRFFGRDIFPRDFKVQASTDMQNWVDVIMEQDYTLPASRSYSWTFDGTEARYIKLVASRSRKFMFFYYVTYISEIEVYRCAEPETPEPEELASTQSADEERSLLSKEAFDREVAGKKGPVIDDATPGRPGKPLFILKENE